MKIIIDFNYVISYGILSCVDCSGEFNVINGSILWYCRLFLIRNIKYSHNTYTMSKAITIY